MNDLFDDVSHSSSNSNSERREGGEADEILASHLLTYLDLTKIFATLITISSSSFITALFLSRICSSTCPKTDPHF
jgi:hypothetical protein